MIVLYAVQITVILLLFPYLQTIVFASSIIPAIAGGWLYGRRKGLLLGLLSVSVAVICQIVLGLYDSPHLVQPLFGAVIVIIVSLAFGHLRDTGIQFKIAVQHMMTAEEERGKLEKQLEQSHKLEAIGTLAGGVAHDMNNILGIIMSSASVLNIGLGDDDRYANDVKNILSACRRGRDLTRNLLGFARKGSYVKEPLDMNHIIAKVTRLLEPAFRKQIRISTELQESLYSVLGDRTQIEQTLLNICINAAESIGDEGAIRIKARNAGDQDHHWQKKYQLESSHFIIIEIADTGQGIDPSVLRHVFEPFFTTKPAGKGTGLGLSMAYGTVTHHGGAIDIQSAPGQGTTLTIILPALDDRQQARVTQRISAIPPAQTSGAILLVDDEPLILTSHRRMLKRLGYDVWVAESGEKAVAMYAARQKEIQLVILDYVMPGMDGAETFEKLKAIDANVSALISSGYSKDGHIEALLENGAVGFIQKPFDAKQIAKLLGKISGST